MPTSHKRLSVGTGYMPSQQECNDLRGVVANLRGKLTLQDESCRLLAERCKKLKEFNKMLI